MTSPRTRLVVLFGGRSAEHEVSCVTAVSVLRALDPARYEVVPVGITAEGRWVLAEEAQRLLFAGRAAALPPVLQARGRELEPFQAMSQDSGPTVVLPLLHGPFGEDGTVQGLLEIADVPYVGAGVLASAVCMDKITFKDLMARAGIPQVDYVGLRDGDDRSAAD
ncbi:MAG TPA: D-alanine--D-alanine ligase A, partial [Acidimicrobiales bacterium]|nr:D-alanine--D-alanine ligase A [Acidimicrobiales bacterium]